MKNSYFILLFFSITLSCNKSKSIKAEFSNTTKLNADKILSINDVYIKSPNIYNLTDSTIAVTTPAKGYSSLNHLIYIFSKKSGKVIRSLGAEGSGPEEMSMINSVSTLNSEIIFYDASTRKILRYDYSNDSVRFQSIKTKQKYFLRNLYLINDKKYLSCGVFDKHMYNYGDMTTGEGAGYLEYPYLPRVSKDKQQDLTLARSYAFMGGMIKQLNGSKFAYFTMFGEYLQIVEFNGSSINEVMNLSYAPPVGEVVFKVDAYVWATNRKSPACFLGGTSSEKYFYLLYGGKLINEEEFYKGKFIFVFDWNGNKIKMIELDKEVYSITVDKNDREIFAYTTNNETLNNEIVHYKL